MSTPAALILPRRRLLDSLEREDDALRLPVSEYSPKYGKPRKRSRSVTLACFTLLAVLLLNFCWSHVAVWATPRGRDTGRMGWHTDDSSFSPWAVPEWATPQAATHAIEEPYCVHYVRYEADSPESPTDSEHDTCFEPFQIGETETGAGLCVCAARLLRIDYASLNAARAAQQPGASDVTCAMLCRRMWENDNCASVPALLHAGLDADADGSAQRVGTHKAAASRRYKLPAVPPSGALELLWARFEVAFRDAGGLDVVAPPGVRGFGGRADVDWVARGVRMKESDVQRARGQWRHFVAHMPPYPEKLFRGRGIITTGGGVKYMVPLLVSIRIVRATGCTLPIEAWFFASEMPAPRLAAELAALGVAVRNVDDIRPGASKDVFKNGDRGFGFVMKAAVLLFSGCEECLYLDSDNAVLTDPEQLFRESGYVDTGLVVWPDYWPPSVAPDMFRIAPEARPPPTSTVESGQVLFHKRTTWRALMLALFMNCQGSLYYNLLTNYMGMGDKETLPMAMRMLQLPYHDVGHEWPTGSAGLMAQRESHDSLGTRVHEHTLEFRSNTMVQYHPSTGALLLLHGNLAKWDLGVPTTWGNYTRRWQVITPAGWRVTDTITAGGDGGGILADTLQSRLEPGYHVLDPERVAWEELTRMRCAPWLNEYLQSLAAPGDVEHVYDNAPTPNGYHFMLLLEHASGKYLPVWGEDGEETHTGGNRLRV